MFWVLTIHCLVCFQPQPLPKETEEDRETLGFWNTHTRTLILRVYERLKIFLCSSKQSSLKRGVCEQTHLYWYKECSVDLETDSVPCGQTGERLLQDSAQLLSALAIPFFRVVWRLGHVESKGNSKWNGKDWIVQIDWL